MTLPSELPRTPVVAVVSIRDNHINIINFGANSAADREFAVLVSGILGLIESGDFAAGAVEHNTLIIDDTGGFTWAQIDYDNLDTALQARIPPAGITQGQYLRGGASGLEAGSLPVSSETVAGLISVANQAMVNAGTNATRAVTPVTLAARLAAVGAAAWSRLTNPSGRIPSDRAASDSIINASMTISGQTLTITLTPRTGSAIVLTATLPSGGSAPVLATHQVYFAYAATPHTFTEADFTGGEGTTTGSATVSGATGQVDFAVWSAMPLSVINASDGRVFGSNNEFSQFTMTRFTIGSTNGYQYKQENVPGGYANGPWEVS